MKLSLEFCLQESNKAVAIAKEILAQVGKEGHVGYIRIKEVLLNKLKLAKMNRI